MYKIGIGCVNDSKFYNSSVCTYLNQDTVDFVEAGKLVEG